MVKVAGIELDAPVLDALVIVALGGNLGGAWATPVGGLEAAVGRLPAFGLDVVARSSWWRSRAWPDPAEPPYINGVVVVETALDPRAVLSALHEIERAFGRRRTSPNAARVLDLDLIAYGRTVMADGHLVLPHPRAADRRFVMGPLAEIAPDWRHPVSGRAARALAEAATVGRDARPVGDA